jgi:aminoglycoside phosphotransferase (APT) family kinase protein
MEYTNVDERVIDVGLVKRLIKKQFPQWRHAQIIPVVDGGWDNRMFHLGDTMLVRLPSASGYVPQVEKEHTWLPILAPQLPLLIPHPVAKGKPHEEFPWAWSIYYWLEGETASRETISNFNAFAGDLAAFLNALERADTEDAPLAGAHCWFRGCSLHTYHEETYQALSILNDSINTDLARAVWDNALESEWQHAPVWFHGDVSPGNLLVTDGKLCAVIDFGCSGIGDPACDLAIAWTFLTPESRNVFRAQRHVDDQTWARGRGWALWKALIILSGLDSNQKNERQDNT